MYIHMYMYMYMVMYTYMNMYMYTYMYMSLYMYVYVYIYMFWSDIDMNDQPSAMARLQYFVLNKHLLEALNAVNMLNSCQCSQFRRISLQESHGIPWILRWIHCTPVILGRFTPKSLEEKGFIQPSNVFRRAWRDISETAEGIKIVMSKTCWFPIGIIQNGMVYFMDNPNLKWMMTGG